MKRACGRWRGDAAQLVVILLGQLGLGRVRDLLAFLLVQGLCGAGRPQHLLGGVGVHHYQVCLERRRERVPEDKRVTRVL